MSKRKIAGSKPNSKRSIVTPTPSELDILKHQIASPLTALLCSLEHHLLEQNLWEDLSPECKLIIEKESEVWTSEKNRKKSETLVKRNKDSSSVRSSVTVSPTAHLQIALQAANEISHYVKPREAPHTYESCEEFCLIELLTELTQSFTKPYPVIITFNADLVTEYQLYGDRRRLKLVLTHILNNAAEAYDKKVTPKTIELWVHRYKDGVVIGICDHGQGMDEMTKKKIFQAQFSTKKDSRGIGLWEANKIIESEFNGEIGLISQPNKGTIVLIRI